MALHPSVIKRQRQSLKRQARNQEIKSRIKTLVKKVRSAIESKNRDVALVQLKEVNRALDKAVTKGLMKRRTASRKLSRLAQSVGHLAAANP